MVDSAAAAVRHIVVILLVFGAGIIQNIAFVVMVAEGDGKLRAGIQQRRKKGVDGCLEV